MALKSSREGLRKELVDYLGNLIIDDNLRNEIIKIVGDNFVTSENLNESVNNLTMQITTESGERIEADDTLQNNITAEATARENADTTLQKNINDETIARQEAITNLEGMIGTSGLQMDLLWTNANPESAFTAQTINLDLSEYKLFLFAKYADTSNSYLCLDVLLKGFNIKSFLVAYSNGSLLYYRSIVITDSNITIGDANVGFDVNNIGYIPYQIYGVK